jgi:hypothetical protein
MGTVGLCSEVGKEHLKSPNWILLRASWGENLLLGELCFRGEENRTFFCELDFLFLVTKVH